jgi:putative transposase
VWSYIGGIAREHGMTALQVGGIENHVHVLVSSPPAMPPSKIAQLLKGGSSFWFNKEYRLARKFAWQDGFGVFSVCKSHADIVVNYISNQRTHHKKQTFEEEFVSLLRLNGIEYDEQYLFG